MNGRNCFSVSLRSRLLLADGEDDAIFFAPLTAGFPLRRGGEIDSILPIDRGWLSGP